MLAGALLAAVRVLVTVLDPETGLPVPGLGAADFVAPSAVVSVAAAEEPVAVLLVLDNSSAGDGLRRTAGEIVARLTARDVVALAPFQGGATAFSGDGAAVGRAVGEVRFGGDPRLWDSVLGALDTGFPAGGYRKVVVLLTAGIEGPNRATESAVVLAAREKGIALYPVYLHGSGRWSFPGIAKQTGGAAFWLREVRSAEAIVAAIRNPYVLTLQGGAGPIKVKGREKTFVSSLPFANE